MYQRMMISLAAGASQTFANPGDWLWFSSGSDFCQVTFDQESGAIPFSPGQVVEREEGFKAFTVINVGTDTLANVFYIGADEPIPHIVAKPTKQTSWTALNDVACGAGALAQILVANKRQVTWVTFLGTGGQFVRLGDSSASASKGVAVPIGTPFMVDGTPSLYVWNPNGASVTAAMSQLSA
jgi:hypothetical protein